MVPSLRSVTALPAVSSAGGWGSRERTTSVGWCPRFARSRRFLPCRRPAAGGAVSARPVLDGALASLGHGASSAYPTPCTVLISSGPSLRRSALTWLSTVLVPD